MGKMPLADNPQVGQYAPLIQQCAEELGLSETEMAALIIIESGGRADAVNQSSKASGLMQIMPSDAGSMFADRPTSAELLNPTLNMEWGCRILKSYLTRYDGDLQRALFYYSGGAWGGRTWERYLETYWSKYTTQVAILKDGQPQGGEVSTTERFIRAAEAEFGDRFEDMRTKVPDQGQGFKSIDSRQMPNIVIHHSASPITTTAQAIWEHHTKKNGWAGIGYHLLIRLRQSDHARVELVGTLDTQRAHVLGMNHLGLGICVAGNFDTRPDVPAPMVDALKRLIRVLDLTYGHEKQLRTHGGAPPLAMLPNYTACPGSALKRLVPTLRQGVAESPQTPAAPQSATGALQELRARLWESEQVLRDLEAAQARLRDNIIHPLKVAIERLEAEG